MSPGASTPGGQGRPRRLYVDAALHEGASVLLNVSQAHYLGTVLGLKAGDSVLVFNCRDGEWRSTLRREKRSFALAIVERTRPQPRALNLHYLFAPLKHARLDYMTQKAVEMGASRLQPVLMRHSQVARVNLERMRANTIEAAEQCGILTLPDIRAPLSLEQMIAELEPKRLLVFCDETAAAHYPIAALAQARTTRQPHALSLAARACPEGGFAQDERAALLKLPNAVRLACGAPRPRRGPPARRRPPPPAPARRARG